MDDTTQAAAPAAIKKVPPMVAVFDGRNRRVGSLWRRGDRFYAQVYVRGKKGPRRVALNNLDGTPCRTVTEAQVAESKVKEDIRNMRGVRAQSPKVCDYLDTYQNWLVATNQKRYNTIESEKAAIAVLKRFFKSRTVVYRMTDLKVADVRSFAMWYKSDGASNQTVNLRVRQLDGILNFAKTEGIVEKVATDDWKPLDEPKVTRRLITEAELQKLVDAALAAEPDGTPRYSSGRSIADWLLLMAYSGARRTSALSAQWSEVDWGRKQLVLNNCKGGKTIVVDFNPALEAHLKAMETRRANVEDDWMFPSPRARTQGAHVASYLVALNDIVTDSGIGDWFTPHHLRHYFISKCVMAGIDYMTIAAWVGHSDGGVLIGKRYGHLTNDHRKQMAAKAFAPHTPTPGSAETSTDTQPETPPTTPPAAA